MRQVEVLLKNGHIRSDPVMTRIFRIVGQDEPDHWKPYHGWLTRQGGATAKWTERWADYWIHKSLMFAKLPAVFLNRGTPRLERWPHEDPEAYLAPA
jgi:hypothetical protein